MFGRLSGKETQTRPQERVRDLAETCRDLRERLDAVESDLDYLGLEVKKLRGKVTGGVRKSREDEAGDANGNGSHPVGSPGWFEAQRRMLGIPGR